MEMGEKGSGMLLCLQGNSVLCTIGPCELLIVADPGSFWKLGP